MYTGVWGLAMLVGSPKGWKTRPPVGALALSWLFWLVVLVIKWSFEYFALVRSMVLPTLALWEADYRLGVGLGLGLGLRLGLGLG